MSALQYELKQIEQDRIAQLQVIGRYPSQKNFQQLREAVVDEQSLPMCSEGAFCGCKNSNLLGRACNDLIIERESLAFDYITTSNMLATQSKSSEQEEVPREWVDVGTVGGATLPKIWNDSQPTRKYAGVPPIPTGSVNVPNKRLPVPSAKSKEIVPALPGSKYVVQKTTPVIDTPDISDEQLLAIGDKRLEGLGINPEELNDRVLWQEHNPWKYNRVPGTFSVPSKDLWGNRTPVPPSYAYTPSQFSVSTMGVFTSRSLAPLPRPNKLGPRSLVARPPAPGPLIPPSVRGRR